MAEVRITTIYDNYEYEPGLQTGWGFSCLVEVGDKKILFDTGADRMIELLNIDRLGIDLRQVDALFLSHPHGDHTGGLSGVLERVAGIKVKVFLGESFPRSIKEKIKEYGSEPVEVAGPMQLLNSFYTTGELPGPVPEQSLITKTNSGLVVITGCAHPGIVEIVRAAREQHEGAPVRLVLGGFHLDGLPERELEQIIQDLKALGVQQAAPCHCSGARTRALFAEAFGEDYIENGVGRVIEV